MFANLAVSGGAHLCIPFLGFLRAIAPILSGVKRVSGCSAGALVAVAWVLDMPPRIVISLLVTMMERGLFSDVSVPLLWCRFGLVDAELAVGATAKKMIDAGVTRWKTIKNGCPPDASDNNGNITMQELAKLTGTSLAVGVCDVGRGFAETFITAETHPNVPVWRALAASCAIPFAFTPVSIGGSLFCDACARNGDPMGGIPAGSGLLDTLLLEVDIFGARSEASSDNAVPATLQAYGKSFIKMLLERVSASRQQVSTRAQTAKIPRWTDEVSLPMVSGISAARLCEAYDHGVKHGKEFLENVNKDIR